MTTRAAGASRSERSSRSSTFAISEQALIDATVVDDVLAGHETVLGAAQERDQVTALLRIGEPAGRTAAQAILDDRLVGRVLPFGMGVKIGPERLGIEETRADAVDR